MDLVISVIGFGNVGKLVGGLLLAYSEHRFKINIVDTDTSVSGAVLDFQHGAELYGNHCISFNSEMLLNQSDVIFHCAGASVPKGQSRLVTAQASIKITEAVFARFQPTKEPFVIVVANPVEVICTITQKLTGLPKQNVIGTGTFLDSIRMNHAVKKANKNALSVDAILLGEHGATAFVSEQLSLVNGQSFNDMFHEKTIEELLEEVKTSASKIKETQKASIYGVSYCAIKVFEALLSEQGSFIPVSTYIPQNLRDSLGREGVYLSLYSSVSQKGAYPIKAYVPDAYELAALRKSMDLITSCIPATYK